MKTKRWILAAALAAALAAPTIADARSRRSSSGSRGKTEHVGGYTRKDGKAVKAYTRHPAGTAPKKGSR